MNRLFVYLGRFFLITVGYAVAALAASLFLNLVSLGALDLPTRDEPAAMVGSLFFSVPFIALFVGYFAFLPAIVVIVAAELFARRDWLFYALGGAGVGAAIDLLVFGMAGRMRSGLPDIAPPVEPYHAADAPVFLLIVAAGMIGGIAYWLCAGRSAGGWRDHHAMRSHQAG